MGIVKAKPKNAQKICELIKESILAIKEHYSKKEIGAWAYFNTPEIIKTKMNNMYVMKSFGRILGVISYTESTIEKLYVHPSKQGKGIGKKLIQFAEKKLKGIEKITIRSGLNAVLFYKKQGYNKVKTSHVVLNSVKITEIIMEKSFTP